MAHSILTVHIDSTDPRLKRHVEHDSRSLEFAVQVPRKGAPDATIFHADAAPILDQADVGGCVGFTGADFLNTAMCDAIRAAHNSGNFFNDDDGLRFYHDATVSDNIRGTYPPDDTGSTGLGLAKALKKAGLIKSYLHAFSWDQYLTALATQPVALGTLWTNKMFKPDKNGVVRVGTISNSTIAGGHEYMSRGRDANKGLNLMRNHWNASWDSKTIGQKMPGEFWIPDADLKNLLANQGDVTVLKVA